MRTTPHTHEGTLGRSPLSGRGVVASSPVAPLLLLVGLLPR